MQTVLFFLSILLLNSIPTAGITKCKIFVYRVLSSPCWLCILEGSGYRWKGEKISIISDTQLSKARITDMNAMASKSRATDDSQTAFGPWNVQGPFSDSLTSNSFRLSQSKSSRCGIYWFSQARRETKGKSKTRFPSPDQFLFCQSCPHQWAQEKGEPLEYFVE